MSDEIPIQNPSSSLIFPARQDEVKATWWPIYIEPVVGSGERICIGIVVANDEKGAFTSITGVGRLRCFYSTENVEFIQKLIDMVGDDLKEHFVGSDTLDGWEPPFDGFFVGEARPGEADTFEEIAKIGLMMCSSLSKGEDETSSNS